MKHILFHENPNNLYKIAVLIKESAFSSILIKEKYIDPLINKGITPDSILALSLKYNDQNKAPAKLIKEHLETVLKACVTLGVDTLLVADSAYFKTLTKQRKAEPHYGYIKKCAIKHFEHINVILCVNYQALFHNPVLQDRLNMSLDTVAGHINNTYTVPGQNIIHHSEYPESVYDIRIMLAKLLKYPVLTCDIETKSLELDQAGIATIGFAWSQHEGCAFAVDRGPSDEVKLYLQSFFEQYTGKLIYHGGTFDIKILIYELFMDDSLDDEGLLDGLEIMYKNIDDTLLITYLATNTTAGNRLSLKYNAFEFTGNYAQDDIDDTTKIPLPELLEYNLIDCLATWYVYNKNYPVMVKDNQIEIYETIMRPSMKVITHMELIGMPMFLPSILNAKHKLSTILLTHYARLENSALIKNYEWRLQKEAMVIANLLLKKKIRPLSDFKQKFNPASNKQLQGLLYDDFGFEVIDTTDSGAPAVGGATINKLLNNLMIEHNLTDEDLL